MSKFKVGDVIECTRDFQPLYTQGRAYAVSGLDEDGDPIITADNGEVLGEQSGWFKLSTRPVSADARLIAKKEAELAALKERAAKKAQQAAARKAKAERAKVMRGLSPAGKRVVAMLQAGSVSDFGCQRDNVIKLAAAITGDKADAIVKALAH